MIEAVLFDLGNTLAEYYESAAYPELLPRCIGEAGVFLEGRGVSLPPSEPLRKTVDVENREAGDHRVRPLEQRLLRIFRPPEPSCAWVEGLCRAFMKPIFDLGRLCDDAQPTLRTLRARGLRLGVVSNAPWGCPASLCHEESARLGLPALVDHVVFCTDVGWRKPAREIFAFALARLHTTPDRCLFVGDHPDWDVAGPRAAGMAAVLLDRKGTRGAAGESGISRLADLRIP